MINDKVSVIIPVYNVKNYLERSVSSIIKQTYTNLEIIIVDDGSTDGSGQLCDILALKDSRIQVIHKINGGLSSARNAGLNVASGEYVFFLDSDDYIKENLIDECIRDIGDAEVITFGYESVDDNDQLLGSAEFTDGEFSLASEDDKLKFVIQQFFKYKVSWSAWSKIYRRSIIVQNNLRYIDNKKIFAEDTLFTIMYVFCCNKIKCVNKKYYRYVKRSDSIMNTVADTKINEMIQLGMQLKKFVEDNKLQYISEHFTYLFHLIIDNRMKNNHFENVSELINRIDEDNYIFLCKQYEIDFNGYMKSREYLGPRTRIERVLYGKVFVKRSGVALKIVYFIGKLSRCLHSIF